MHALHRLRQLHLISDKDDIGGGACHGNKITAETTNQFLFSGSKIGRGMIRPLKRSNKVQFRQNRPLNLTRVR
jgi:hypothetical protein